jgi:hypothetical protein
MSVMNSIPVPAPASRRPSLLAAGALGLLLAVFLVPFRLASAWPGGYPNVTALSDQMSASFVRYWHSASPADLAGPVEYWARFHIFKAIFAALLLMVLIPLGARTWSAYTHAARRRRSVLAITGVVHAAVTVLALLVLVANIQGGIAPLSSALGLMPLRNPDPALAQTVSQVRHALATGEQSAALDALVADYARYHAALAAVGAVVTLALLTVAVGMWRHRRPLARSAQRNRRVLLLGVVSVLLLAAFFALITAANLSTVAHPAPALLSFFNGSF